MATSVPPPVPPRDLADRPELPLGVVRPDPPAPGLRAMPLWAPLAVLLGGVAVSLVVAALTAMFVLAIGADIDSDGGKDALAIFGTIGQAIAWISFAVLAVRLAARSETGVRLGLRPTRLWPALGWAALAYLGFWIGSGLITAIFGTPPTEAEQQLIKELRDERELWSLVGFAVMATLAAPLSEEVLFRGLLFGTLRSRIGLLPAALASGVLFGLIHFDAPVQGIMLLCVFGIALCLLYEATGSLLPGIGLHALHNALTFSVTKELPWWGFIGVCVAGCAGAILLGMALMRARVLVAPPRVAAPA